MPNIRLLLAVVGLALVPCATRAAPSAKVPFVNAKGQAAYRKYLKFPLPRAFAISSNGKYAFATGTAPRDPMLPADPKERALQICRGLAGRECVLYSVNKKVVFRRGQRMPSATARAPARAPEPAPLPEFEQPAPLPPPPAPAPAPLPAAPPPAFAQQEPPPRAFAQEPPPPRAEEPLLAAPAESASLRFVLQLNVEHQLTAIQTVDFSDRSSAGIGTILGGFSLGAAYPLTSDGRYEIQALAGAAVSRVSATNGNVTYYEIPVDVTAHMYLGSFRLGLGPTVHLMPRLRGDGFANDPSVSARYNVDYGIGLGAIGEADYILWNRLVLGVRGMWLRESARGASFNWGRVGGVIGYRF